MKTNNNFLFLLLITLPIWSINIRSQESDAHQKNLQNIYVFGDSHAYFGFSDNTKLDYILPYNEKTNLHMIIRWFYSKTMHGFAKPEFSIGDHAFQEHDIIIFTFGEVDVRCHIGKQRDLFNRDVDEIMDLLIVNYFKKINQLLTHPTIRCIIAEVMPPTDTCFNPGVPTYGTLPDRVAITRKLNKKLQEACRRNNAIFLPLYDIYTLPDGSINHALSDRCNHVAFHHNHLTRQRLLEVLRNAQLV